MITPDTVDPTKEMRFKFAKALFAFLVLPGIVAFALPLWMAPRIVDPRAVHWVGLPSLAVGLVVLMWCVRDFYVTGRGTLAPWTPPQKLVVVGLYKWSRNPMYLGVVMMLGGWAIWFSSSTLFQYLGAVFVMFELRVLYGEEPWLARVHGKEWTEYVARVPRWLFWR